jgi:hypothetical protein
VCCGQTLLDVHLIAIGIVEAFDEALLDAYVFETVDQVRTITEDWLREQNEERPHDGLGRKAPLSFMSRRVTTLELCS